MKFKWPSFIYRQQHLVRVVRFDSNCYTIQLSPCAIFGFSIWIQVRETLGAVLGNPPKRESPILFMGWSYSMPYERAVKKAKELRPPDAYAAYEEAQDAKYDKLTLAALKATPPVVTGERYHKGVPV